MNLVVAILSGLLVGLIMFMPLAYWLLATLDQQT